MCRYCSFVYFCRYAYMETLKKLKWGKVAALTQDGQKYSDYISEMQVNNLFFTKLKIFTKEDALKSPT
jgi:hypothetical protein